MTRKSLFCSLTRSTLPFQIGLYLVCPHENFPLLIKNVTEAFQSMGQNISTPADAATKPSDCDVQDENSTSPLEHSTVDTFNPSPDEGETASQHNILTSTLGTRDSEDGSPTILQAEIESPLSATTAAPASVPELSAYNTVRQQSHPHRQDQLVVLE